MRYNRRFFAQSVILFAVYVLTLFSCATTKNVAYFKDLPDTLQTRLITDAPYKDPLIIPDDILSVTIVTIDPTTAAPVNQNIGTPVSSSSILPGGSGGSSGGGGGGSPQLVPGILVDKNGDISLPIIGKVRVAGLTTYQAKELIRTKAEQYFKEPDVQLRFTNFKITVLGEVLHPSTFVVPSEKVSVLDALGMAGDLTIYGRRENVLLIREINGQKQLVRLNLNSSDLFKSDYFYLKQNDVIYVEPNKSKAVQADASQTRVITILASIISALLIVLIRVK
jgi:polysaccharide export outer membrane protein